MEVRASTVEAQSSSVTGGIGQTIREMDAMVEGIAAAVHGGPSGGGAGGLAQLAEVLRAG